MQNENIKDWRDIVDSPSKLKYERKYSMVNSHRSRITRATGYAVLAPGASNVRVERKVLIVIDLKSNFDKNTINDFLKQALEFYGKIIGVYLKVYISLFDGEYITKYINLKDYENLEYVETNDNNEYNKIIISAKKNDIDEVLIFTDGKNINDNIKSNDVNIKYCFDTEENNEKAENITMPLKGCFVLK